MKGKTEQLLSPSFFHHQLQVDRNNFCAKSSSTITGNGGVSSMINQSSEVNKPWNMGSLMAELPLSSSSIQSPKVEEEDDDDESPNHPRFSCRPSTVFYSPTRFQDMKTSNTVLDLKKGLPSYINATSSYELSKNFGFVGGVQSSGYEPSVDFDVCKCPLTAAVLDKSGTTAPSCDEFGEAIPMTDEEGSENRSNCHFKPSRELLDEVHNRRESEVDEVKKATYTHLLRKLTKKEEAIDEWESKRRSKAELQLDKLERKLEQRRAEAIQKVHNKLAETKMEAQKKKAKARRLALKEMEKYCSQIN